MKVFELIFNEDKHLIDRVSIVGQGQKQTGYSLQSEKMPVILANMRKESFTPSC
jgi:hypothetical protein